MFLEKTFNIHAVILKWYLYVPNQSTHIKLGVSLTSDSTNLVVVSDSQSLKSHFVQQRIDLVALVEALIFQRIVILPTLLHQAVSNYLISLFPLEYTALSFFWLQRK